MNFSMDQGTEMLRAWEIWKNKEITMLGPTASPEVNGRHFFNGSVVYYWLVGLGLLTRWEPVGIAWGLAIMSLISLGFWWLAVRSCWGEKTAWIMVLIWTLLPKAIDFGPLIWNPNMLLILTGPIAFFWTKRNYVGLGIMLGLALQCHFQAGLIIILIGITMMLRKCGGIEWLKIIVGGIVGYAPLLIFDIRNNFYNIKTLGEWLVTPKKDFGVQEFYFLEFLPLLVALVAKFLTKNKSLIRLVIIGLLSWSIYEVGFLKQAKGMATDWRYIDLKKTGEIIKKEAGNNFNIVNTLSGDIRFYPLRYWLIKEGKAPMAENKYENMGEVWVVKYNLQSTIINLQSEPWELEVNKDKKVAGTWKINDKVELVRLK